MILSLIEAHAVLHQASRARNAEGHIVAELDDYAVVRELINDLVADGVEATVSTIVKETVQAVSRLVAAKGNHPNCSVTVTEVAHALGLDKSAALRRVQAALERGYLLNLETRRAQPAKLVLGEPLPEQIEILPPPDDLKLGVCTVDPAAWEGMAESDADCREAA